MFNVKQSNHTALDKLCDSLRIVKSTFDSIIFMTNINIDKRFKKFVPLI